MSKFEEMLERAFTNIGMSEKAFESMLRDEEYLSDNKIFVISRLIDRVNPNRFINKKIGHIYVKCKMYGVAIEYVVESSNPCKICVDFDKFTLLIKYSDYTLTIDENLIDYKEERSKLLDLREEVLNEILVRYFSKVLHVLYRELRWYLE